MQLELRFSTEAWLQEQLESLTGMRVALTLTDNSRTIMSMRPDGASGGRRLRLHRMFLEADADVVRAVAAWVKKPRSRAASPVLDAFIRSNRHQLRRRSKRIVVRQRGAVHDLRAMFDTVNAQHFDNTVTASITWGRRGNGNGRQRTIRFGSYNVEDHLIRIHPALDQAFVPAYFVRYIVFHEMLHAHLGIEESETGRRRIHTPEFLRLERRYPDYARAIAWERAPGNMRKLLKTCRAR